jgi:DNA-binding MarR family transcriptional regulator
MAEDVQRTAALVQNLRAVLSKLKRRLREQGNAGDLTPSQTSVLLRLEKDGPATASALARAEGMRPQSIVPIIMALEAADLVAGAPDPDDGRQTILSLTKTFRAMMAKGRAAREDWMTQTILARLSAQEQDTLAKAVILLQRLAD